MSYSGKLNDKNKAQDQNHGESLATSYLNKGIGAQVKKTVMNKNVFLPQISESAPMSGAERKDRMPLIPLMRPGNVEGKGEHS